MLLHADALQALPLLRPCQVRLSVLLLLLLLLLPQGCLQADRVLCFAKAAVVPGTAVVPLSAAAALVWRLCDAHSGLAAATSQGQCQFQCYMLVLGPTFGTFGQD